MHKAFLIVIFSLSFPFNALAAEEPVKKNLNQIMTEIGGNMVKMFPVIVAKRELSDQEQTELKNNVTQLSSLFKQAGPFIQQKSSTYQISYDLVLEYLKKTETSFQINHIDYTRKRLYSLGSICASCHTQDTTLRTYFPGIDRSHFIDDQAYAEFNFITRNYSEAAKYFDLELRSDIVKTEYDIIVPMQRLITIYTQIYDTPEVVAKQLEDYRELADHTNTTRKHLDGWIKGLKNLANSDRVADKDMTFKILQTYVAKYIAGASQASAEFFSTPEDEVSRVWLRGRLYHYLNTNPPAEEIPVILYWLSVCDRSIGFDYSFSLADLYLKQCVRNYSKHPYAKQCYKEYKDFVEISYSGSAGTFIPPELKKELAELKKYIDNPR